jgi:hypothetical protein
MPLRWNMSRKTTLHAVRKQRHRCLARQNRLLHDHPRFAAFRRFPIRNLQVTAPFSDFEFRVFGAVIVGVVLQLWLCV